MLTTNIEMCIVCCVSGISCLIKTLIKRKQRMTQTIADTEIEAKTKQNIKKRTQKNIVIPLAWDFMDGK